jgi:glyoxylase-like metal-dependent hydrolase (beta-lactamase superfamily II)
VDCLHTPGHTPGCTCFLADGRLISGDTLFVRSVGNTDHPKGDVDALYTSLRRLEELPQETRIYPGHDTGEETSSTLGRELEINAYMRPMEREQFRILMGYL